MAIRHLSNWGGALRSLGIGLVGALIAHVFNVPLAWMLGALIAAMIVSLMGVEISIPKTLRSSSRGVVGLILGASVTTETLGRVPEWPLSLVLLIIGITVIAIMATSYYRHVAGFDKLTALSASLPGAISTIPMIAIQMGADPRRVVLPHLFRVTLIVLLVPPMFSLWQGVGAGPGSDSGFQFDLWGENFWILLLLPPAWWIARAIKLPIPELTGPMFASAVASLLGFQLALPDWLFAFTFIVLGSSIGARFYKMPLALLVGTGRHAFVGTLITLSVTVVVALCIHWATGVPLPVALLAMTPGGIAEMAILSAALGVDPVFVAFHQIFRSILLNTLSPFLLRRFGGAKPPGS